MRVSNYRIDQIKPEEKDLMRARNLNFRSSLKGGISETPLQGKADSMAKLITDPEKLIRRAKAIACYWGTADIVGEIEGVDIRVNVFRPFAKKLEENGYTWSEIDSIGRYQHDDVFEQLGLEDLLL